MGVCKDLIGKRFGRLTVLSKTNEVNASGSVFWKCKCDCGKILRVSTSSLNSGQLSCGCIKDFGDVDFYR